MADTWDILTPLFHWIGVQIPESNVRSMLGNGYVLPVYISKLWRSETNSITMLSSIRKMQLETHMQVSDSNAGAIRQSSSDKQLLLQSLKSIQNEITRVLSTTFEDPESLIHNENVCLLVAFTLLRDRWHENKKSTKPRNPNVRYTYIVWTLMLAYRYKRREHTFKENKAFKGHHFHMCIEPSEDGDITSILEWEPWRVYQALISLDTKYIRDIVFYDDELVDKMFLLRDLLLDRCSIIAFSPLSGTSEHLMQNFVLWMKCKETEEDKDDESDDKKNLAEFIDMDILQRLKQEKKYKDTSYQANAVYDPSIEKNEKLLSEKLRSNKEFLDEYMKNITTHETDNLKGTLTTLYKLKAKYDDMFVRVGSELEAPSALVEANARNNVNIMQVKNLLDEIASIKDREISEEEADKIETMRKKTIASIIKGSDITSSSMDKHGNRGIYYAFTPWFVDNVFPALSLCKWQRMTIDLRPMSSMKHMKLKYRLLKDALRNMTIVDPITLSERIKSWIIRIESTSMRREIYRYRTNYKSTFEHFSAWKQIYQNHTSEINRFPTTMKEYLNNDNPFHFSALSFIGYDFISQHFPKIDLDTSFFYWDIEDEYMTLERGSLRYPLICQVGSNWAIYDPPTDFHEDPWTDETSGMLKVRVIGRDFFDCLTQFCFLAEKRKWRIEQRVGNKELDLSLSTLARITKDIIAEEQQEQDGA